MSYEDLLRSHGHSYPPFLEQAGNLAKAMIDYAASGFEGIDEGEQTRRFKICQSCEWFDQDQTRCQKCGCYVKLKSQLMSSHCPVGKW